MLIEYAAREICGLGRAHWPQCAGSGRFLRGRTSTRTTERPRNGISIRPKAWVARQPFFLPVSVAPPPSSLPVSAEPARPAFPPVLQEARVRFSFLRAWELAPLVLPPRAWGQGSLGAVEAVARPGRSSAPAA